MKITDFLYKHKNEYPTNALLTISSNDGMTFISFSFFNPFRVFFERNQSYYSGNFIEISSEIDIVIPGFEFTLCFLGFHIFFRHNKKEAQKIFDEFNKQIEAIQIKK